MRQAFLLNFFLRFQLFKPKPWFWRRAVTNALWMRGVEALGVFEGLLAGHVRQCWADIPVAQHMTG